MILEVAMLHVIPGQEADFQSAFGNAQHIVASMKGYISHQLQRCLEKPNIYVLLIRWQTLEDHTQGFRGSAHYQDWKKALHHFYDPFPEVLHFESVYEGDG